jgi:hypothetical protein
VCGDVWVRDEGGSDRCEGDEEIGTKVCAQTSDKAYCSGEGNLFFDVEIEARELVDGYYGVEGRVVGFELFFVSKTSLSPMK